VPWGSPSALQGLYAARVPIRTLLSDNFEGGNWHAHNHLLMSGGFWPFTDMWHSCRGAHIQGFFRTRGHLELYRPDVGVGTCRPGVFTSGNTYSCRADGWSRTSPQKKVSAEGADQQVSSSRKCERPGAPISPGDF